MNMNIFFINFNLENLLEKSFRFLFGSKNGIIIMISVKKSKREIKKKNMI